MPRSLPPLALAYHGVADVRLRDDPHSLFTPPRLLRHHIGRLRRWGYRFTTFGALADLVRDGRAGGHVALTFDDGLADNRTALLPLLREEGVPATVFVATSFVGGRHPDPPHAPMLGADDIVELAAAGIEIGGHSHSHRDLTTLSFDAVRDDLSRSLQILGDLLGGRPRAMAYPFGAATEETRQACREAGFVAAARTAGEGSWDDPHDLPRQDMHSYSGPLGLWLKRDNRYEPLMHGIVGRAVRSVGRRAKTWVR